MNKPWRVAECEKPVLSDDHIFNEDGRHFFVFAVADGKKFDAQQLRVISNLSKTGRDYFEKIIGIWKRLDRRAQVEPN
jgi:hypothetical protein